MLLDFREIPQANVGGGLQDTFELFTRDFLAYLGYRIVQDPDRGADGKKDLIVDEIIKGITSEYTIRWLVSCKHYAHSGAAVKDSDEINISERLKQHSCDGFMGVYSTLAATSLTGLLSGIKNYQIFDREKIESRLLSNIEGYRLAARYFPQSFKKYQVEHPEPATIFSDQEPLVCEWCGKNLFLETVHGNYVCLQSPPFDDDGKYIEGDGTIKKIYFCCKQCDRYLSEKYRKEGLWDAGWYDIDDLLIPTIWIKKLMAFLNTIQEGDGLDKDAFESMKHMFLATFPHISRHLTEKEKKRVISLFRFEDYGL